MIQIFHTVWNVELQFRVERMVFMALSGQERREQIIKILKQSDKPIPGTELAKLVDVSRQVVVQDMALIRANGIEITSTNRGYIIQDENKVSRVFKVIHTSDQVEEELNLYVDFGAVVEDVFVYHKVYGLIKVPMNIRSRRDVKKYLDGISSGKSSELMNLTSNYHYHTVSAESEEVLDQLQEELWERGYLAKLQDYEPVEFGKK